MREITREELDHCIQRCGADAELEAIMRQIDAEDRQARSIAESPIWTNPQFFEKFEKDLRAIAQEKSRETTKHYIDSAKQPAAGPKSRMGIPRRGADGRVIWDEGISSGQFDPASAHLRKAQQGSLQNCGQCAYYNQDKTCQIVTGPVSGDLTCDKFRAIPAKPVSLVYGAASRDSVQRKNVTADGKIDPTKSIMGTPKRNSDGSISWT